MATLSKSPKKPVSKAKVGTGKSNTKLFSKLPKNKWKLGYLSMVAFLLLGTIGYAGAGVYQSSQLKAKAASWTQLYEIPNSPAVSSMRACKTYIPSTPYGPLYKVSLQVFRNDSRAKSIKITVGGNSGIAAVATNDQWLFGSVSGVDTYASAALHHLVWFSVNQSFATEKTSEIIGYTSPATPGYFGNNFIDPALLANC